MKNQSGLTFIEVLIILTIIAILASIFVPAYQDYLYRGENPNWKEELKTERGANS